MNLEELFEGLLQANNIDKEKMDDASLRNARAFFYSGAAIMLDRLLDAVHTMTDEEGTEMLNNYKLEIRNYFKDVQKEN